MPHGIVETPYGIVETPHGIDFFFFFLSTSRFVNQRQPLHQPCPCAAQGMSARHMHPNVDWVQLPCRQALPGGLHGSMPL